MCGDPSPETFGVSGNVRRPLAGDFRSVGKRAAPPRRRLSECRKTRGDPSPGTFGVSENARRPLAGDFRSVGRCAARGRRTFCTFFEVSQRLKYHFVEPNHFGIGHPFLELRDDAVGTFLERNIDPVFYHAYGYRSPAKLLT